MPLKDIDRNLTVLQKSTVPETLLHMTKLLPDILATADNRLPMFLEFWSQASRDKKIWEASIQPYRSYRAQFAELVETGITDGTLKKVDPQIAGQLILSMAVGLLLQGLLDPESADWGKTARASMQILMEGLAK